MFHRAIQVAGLKDVIPAVVKTIDRFFAREQFDTKTGIFICIFLQKKGHSQTNKFSVFLFTKDNKDHIIKNQVLKIECMSCTSNCICGIITWKYNNRNGGITNGIFISIVFRVSILPPRRLDHNEMDRS